MSTFFSLKADLNSVEVAKGVTLRYWEAGTGAPASHPRKGRMAMLPVMHFVRMPDRSPFGLCREPCVSKSPRLKEVAADLVEHFEARNAAIEGKGMIEGAADVDLPRALR